jgi:hypothetical protein
VEVSQGSHSRASIPDVIEWVLVEEYDLAYARATESQISSV